MTRTQQEHHRIKEARLREACLGLAQDIRFQTFMEQIRDMREDAVGYMVDHTTVKDERDYLAAVGEVRAWDWLLRGYQANLQAAQAQAEAGEE